MKATKVSKALVAIVFFLMSMSATAIVVASNPMVDTAQAATTGIYDFKQTTTSVDSNKQKSNHENKGKQTGENAPVSFYAFMAGTLLLALFPAVKAFSLLDRKL